MPSPRLEAWVDGSRTREGRLAEAALALYVERGFEQTTVADIAERAGLTARTFFRHFADKREVLFAGRRAAAGSDAGGSRDRPRRRAAAGRGGRRPRAAAGDFFSQRRDVLPAAQRVIAANPELQERELIKMAAIAGAWPTACARAAWPSRTRGWPRRRGSAVFRVAFDRWVRSDEAADLQRLVVESFAELRAVTAQR